MNKNIELKKDWLQGENLVVRVIRVGVIVTIATVSTCCVVNFFLVVIVVVYVLVLKVVGVAYRVLRRRSRLLAQLVTMVGGLCRGR